MAASRKTAICPECFKVTGSRSRYSICRILARRGEVAVSDLARTVGLRQPTVTHHLRALRSVGAVGVRSVGRFHYYLLNRGAHCFRKCKIPL